jgi:mycofactocin precursor
VTPGTDSIPVTTALLEAPMEQTLETTEITDAVAETTEDALVEEELLVEEISIDGMCGVY